MEIIRKDFAVESFELKSSKDEDGNEQKTVEGFATTYGNSDAVNDIIARGAFGKRFNAKKIKFLYQHDMREPIGVMQSIKETEEGIFIKAKFSDTARGRDAHTLAKDGAIDAFSIGFSIDPKGYTFDEKKGSRIITKATLMEVSAVTFPANDKARITAVKTFDEDGTVTKRNFEHMLTSMGLSRKEAQTFISGGYPALETQWDVEKSKDNQRDVDLKQLENLSNLFKGNKND